MGSEGLELVGGRVELGTGHFGDLFGNGFSKTDKGVDTRTDSGAALGQKAQITEGALDTLDAVVELGDIAGELLGEGERGGILQVGAANLDNLLSLELVNLGLKSVAQGLNGGEQLSFGLENGSDVHDGGEGVVGRGGAVDVVVGVDGRLGAHGAAEDFNSTVGDDLVGVHVGLCAGAGLPDDEGEVVHEFAVGNLLGGLLDGHANLRVEAKLHVDSGSGTLEDTKGLDDGRGHAVLGLVDLEVFE